MLLEEQLHDLKFSPFMQGSAPKESEFGGPLERN
jgi:hypothetical protein